MLPLEFCWFDWDCWGRQIKDALEWALNKVLEILFTPVLTAIADALGNLLATMATFWINVDTPTPDAGPTGTTVTWLQGRLWYFVFVAATVSLIIAGMRMAWERRGEPLREVLKSLLTLVVVMGLAVTVVTGLTQAGDRFAECVITSSITPGLDDPNDNPNQRLDPPDLPGGDFTDASCNPNRATGVDFGRNLLLMMIGTSAASGTPAMGIVMAITMGLLSIVASLLQVMMMIVRNGMLVLLLGVLPLAAAATNTEMGRTWFKRCVTWLVAFLAYKPVAALIYAAALRLASTPITPGELEDTSKAIVSSITGFVMMVLALFALPALMRLLTPLVAATAGSNLMPAFVGAMAGIAAEKATKSASKGAEVEGDGPTGARNAPSSGSSQGPQGSQGGQGPQGPQGAPGSPGASGPAPASTGASSSASASTSASASAGTAGATAGSVAAGAATAGVATVAIEAAKTAKEVGKAAADGVKDATEGSAGEGPSGSR